MSSQLGSSAGGRPRPSPADRLGVAVVGCGLIGNRRATIARQAGAKIVAVADVDRTRAQTLATQMDCLATADWRDAIDREDVDVVIVSTTNNWLAPIATAAVSSGKHVLVEKPMARDLAEARALTAAAGYSPTEGTQSATRPTRLVAAVGFNHRHHRALWKAHELYQQGAIGDILSIRCRYGHGGRPGYEKEWRTDPALSGGGELLDQGIHAIDLFRWFIGNFSLATGFAESYVWTSPSTVEDNGFALFRSPSGQVASLHASWTQWKNIFSFEVFGREGYLIIDGLGGSYGPERLVHGRRLPQSSPPDERQFDFQGPDGSWAAEWQDFVSAIAEEREPLATVHDGQEAIKMVSAVYESAKTGRAVQL